jgi:uncharacterized protein
VFLIALVLGAGALAGRAEKVEQLKPQGYVNDFADVLDQQSRAQLSALSEEVDKKAGAQIAVVTVRSLEGLPIEEFSINLATRWGIGPKKSDRGVLILLAIEDHKYRVEVGYGLEPILPDGKVGGFGREIVPQLRQRDYGGALLQLTGRIATVIAQDRGVTLSGMPPMRSDVPRVTPGESPAGWRLWLTLLVILLIFVPPAFYAYLWFLSLMSGTLPRRRGSWGGGWSGGGFGGAGGFGGFGGGGFGGGGASGSW